MKPWITITVTGTTVGAFVAAVTYTATSQTSEIVATGAEIGISTAGTIGSYVATALFGEPAGVSVRIASNIASKVTRESVAQGGKTTAAVVSAASGVLTALSITAGTYIINYSIEYGGILSEHAAQYIAEQYIRYKTDQNGFLCSGRLEDLLDEDWVVIDSDEVHPDKKVSIVELSPELPSTSPLTELPSTSPLTELPSAPPDAE